MATLSLKVEVVEGSVTKTMQFDPTTIIFDACKIIRDKINEASKTNHGDFGLFLKDEDPKKGVWLEARRTLDYYLLRNGDLLQYKKKQRILRVRMLDGSVKTLQVDDSHTVEQLMITICSRIGITNHDEYSLVRELSDDEREKTLTLKRDRSIAKDQKKLDEMKRKLHTDDELNWLDHSKTLREQGVDIAETLLLRRKFFFSDQNVDARDPVQLNLLYVQTRDAILKGAHPVSQDEAWEFSGIQCQIQFGDHNPQKHKSNFIELKEFVALEYRKEKGAVKKIYLEHAKCAGLTEIEGKVKYTQLARSLKTYGITFFLVKEKMKGKNKLVPQLLGITKDCVERLDAKTKEVKQTWSLERVKRWAASPNSFTLDFGDYSDSYYSVQTTEGEQISQLIAGYIDIIIKKRKAHDHMGIEGDEEVMMEEDNVSPAQAMIIQQQAPRVDHANMGSVALPAVLRAGGGGESQFHTGSLRGAKFPHVSNHTHSGHMAQAGHNAQMHGLNQSQRGLLSTIDTTITTVTTAQSGLNAKANLPDLGSDAASRQWRLNQEDMTRQNISAQMSAMNAATARVVTLTSAEDDTDYAAVGSAVATISSNIGQFSKDMRMLAALQDTESDGDRLLDAARRLAGAFTDLLKAAQPGDQEPRQNLLNAASRIGEASHDIMETVGETGEEEVNGGTTYEENLVSLAKAVANATAALVLKAKGVSSKCEDQATQNVVIHSATQCALATSQLVACTKVVSSTIQNPSCQEQLVDSAKLVAKSVDGVMATAHDSLPGDAMLDDLGVAAGHVTQALEYLLKHIRGVNSFSRSNSTTEAPDGAVNTILTATDALFSSSGDTGEMVKQARILAYATSSLVNALKVQAEEHTDSTQQKKLLAAAKQLADATARMVEAAKGCASNPQDKSHQVSLREAAEDLRTATSTAASSSVKHNNIKRLEAASRYAATAATQLVNSAATCIGKQNRSSIGSNSLTMQCKNVTDMIPPLVQGIKGTMNNPEAQAFHQALINAARDLLQPSGKLVMACKATSPTVGDQALQMSLNYATQNMAAALAELSTAVGNAADSCTSNEIDNALDQLQRLENDLDDLKQAANSGQLKPLPGDTVESSANQLSISSKTVGSSMAALLTAAAQGNDNYTCTAARDTAAALKVLAQAVRGVASTTNDRALQNRLIECAHDIMDKSAILIEEAQKAVQDPDNPENQTRLAQVAKSVSQALNNCVNCLPGLREVDQAVKHVTTISHRLTIKQFPQSNRSYQEVQTLMNNSAVSLNQAASDVINAAKGAGPSHQIALTSNRFSKAYEDFLDSGLEFAGSAKNQETRSEIVTGLRSVSMTSSKLLVTTKTILADPEAPNTKNLLANAARGVTDSINQLIITCTTSAPGQKECDNALRQIQMMRNMLVDPSESISDATYQECLDGVIHKSKDQASGPELETNLLQYLGDAMTGITSNAKNGQIDRFCDSVRNFANAIGGLTENSAQAAYLVGIADSASEPGRPGLVDQSQFARANQAIQMVCQSFTNPAASKDQVLESAKIIAKNTSMLCTTCKEASERTSNQVAKRRFIEAAKEVANCTARLVKVIKDLDGDFSPSSRQMCANASNPLMDAVDDLTAYASSPEFVSVPAKISPEAREAQVPITSAGLAMIDGASLMMQSAKQLAVTPDDPPTYQRYSEHSKAVSDAIKKLLSAIRENAPGQRECEAAGAQIERAIQDLDQACMKAISQNLEPAQSNSLNGYQEQMMNSARQLLEVISPLRNTTAVSAHDLGHLSVRLGAYMQPLTHAAIGTASKTMNSREQMMLLEETKTVAEAMAQLLIAAKESSSATRDAQGPSYMISDAAQSLQEMLQELIITTEKSASLSGNSNIMVDSISKAVAKMDDPTLTIRGNKSFVDFQTSIVELAKQVAYTAQDMTSMMRQDSHMAQLEQFVVGKSGSNVSELGNLANTLATGYCSLAESARGALATSAAPEVVARIKSSVKDLGTSCIDLVNDAGTLQNDPTDSFSKQDLSDHARQVSEKVSRLLSSLQAGSRGTQACINAASTVSGIIGDLDTTIMFATAGTLNPDVEADCFSDHRESILKTAKSLVEDTKTLVTGAASNQEQLAAAAQSAVMTITRLADSVKHGAASLTSDQPEAQVLLINAVKDVASALGDLVSATKYASGKSAKDPSMSTLSDSAKIMVRNVKSLLDTVKTVENEAARGTRALESSVDAISLELRSFTATDRVEKTLSAESLIRATKPITRATAKTVAAGNSCRQEDMIVAANLGRKAVHELLYTCRCAAAGADDEEIRERALDAGSICAQAYHDLLEQVLLIVHRPNSPEIKRNLTVLSSKVASAVTEVVHSAEAIKGLDWVDPDDPIVIAETQLLGAANAIEAAARKLEQLQPRKTVKAANENLTFEEQIVEAAKSIAAATGALIKAATAAQRELIAQGKVGAYTATYDEDSEWSQGLISAAKQVAAATQSLCDAANELIQGHASEEKLISSAKLVASNTAKLLVACRVKADPNSAAMHRLQAAGNAVKRATDALVKAALAAKRGVTTYEEELTIEVNERTVGGITQIINAREEILRKEKELEKARRRLEGIYQAKYQSGQSEDEADDSSSSQF